MLKNIIHYTIMPCALTLAENLDILVRTPGIQTVLFSPGIGTIQATTKASTHKKQCLKNDNLIFYLEIYGNQVTRE